MIFHSPLLNILINLVSVGKYNFFNWGTFVPQGTVYGVFLMGTVPGLMRHLLFQEENYSETQRENTEKLTKPAPKR
jgi:hypothetical protein